MFKLLSYAATVLALSTLSLLAETREPGRWIEGKATVIDGDSIEIDGTLVRLFGIDAPELEQRCYSGNLAFACGNQSAEYLSDMIYGQHVRCQINEIDRYDRILGSCAWNGRNVAEVMVLSGQAFAWTHHTSLYKDTENAAKANKAGIWRTDFARPHEWRLAVERKKRTR